MKLYRFSEPGYQNVVDNLVNRSNMDLFTQDETVRKILNDVKLKGDKAVLQLTHQYDQHSLSLEQIRVTVDEIKAAYKELKKEELNALREAANRIRLFHERQRQDSWVYEEEGITLGQMVRPIEVAGIYVPGGKASYPSSVLMNAIPAKVAGVKRIVMAVPQKDKNLNPVIAKAAEIANIDEIYRVGGAHSIAALAYGTNSIKPVDKIVGPGNIYVTIAKKKLFGDVGIDMLAGPSEILVLADKRNNPDWIASDLLSQAEHDTNSRSILITNDLLFAKKVLKSVKLILKILPREKIASKSWENNGKIIVLKDFSRAVDIINQLSPEHLELSVKNYNSFLNKIQNAGSIFLGKYTPEAIGDYVAGPNHVLPTGRTARFSSGLGVIDFLKKTTFTECSKKSLQLVSNQAIKLAEVEGLGGHALSISIRKKNNS